jgi:hypothetical protein
MQRMSWFVFVLVACNSGTWTGARFAGRAPDPTIVAPLDCVPQSVRDWVSDREGKLLAEAIVRAVGEGGAYTIPARAACQEVGAHLMPLGHMPDSGVAVAELARATGAASVLVPVLQRSAACHNESLAIRDRYGGRIGGIDTGRLACDGYPPEIRLFLFDASGELLWVRWARTSPSMGLYNFDEERARIAELFAAVPAKVVAR